MDPELKAYLDDWVAEQHRVYADILASMDALNRSMLHTSDCFFTPVTASSGEAELVTSSARASTLPAPVAAIGEPLAVPPAAPIDTIIVVPTSCSTECAAKTATVSTTTAFLPGAPVSSPAPPTASATNGVVSTELAHNNDAGEHGNHNDATPLPSAPKGCSTECVPPCSEPEQDTFQIVGVTTGVLLHEGVPVLAAADETLDGEPIQDIASAALTPTIEWSLAVTHVVPNDRTPVVHAFCLADGETQVVTAPLPTPATTTPSLLWSSPSGSITDFRCHGLLLRPTPWPSFLVGQLNTTENRPGPWPSFTSSCGGGRPKQSRLPPQERYPSLVQWKKKPTCFATKNLGPRICLLATAGAVTSILLDTIDCSYYYLHLGADQRSRWPPPDQDLKVLCSNDVHSLQLTNAILEAHSSGYAPSSLKIYVVKEENQKTPCLCEVVPGAIPYGPDYFRWEIAWVLVVSSSADIGNASDLATTASTLDAYAKAWERPKDPSDLEYYLKAHYCHDVQLQTAMQDAPSGLEDMLICDEYAEDQPESQQLTKFSSEPSKGFSDCEGLPVCTHNIFVCWESDIVPPPCPYMSRCDNSKSRPIPWPSFADLSGGVHITEPRPPLQGTWGEFFSAVELHCFSYGLSGISPLPMCLQYEQQPCFPWSRPVESVCKLSGKIIQAGLVPPEEYLFVWLQPKPPWSYILIKIDAEVEERGVHLRVAEITSVQLILFKLLLPVGICLYELPLPGYSLYSSSFGSASEELFRESKKLEFNNWVSYMLEQYNYISTCGINTELQSLCECTNRPLREAAGIPDSNKQLQLCMAAIELFILQNQGHRWMSHEFAPLCYCCTTLLAAQGADTDGIVTRKQYRVLVQRTEVPWDPDGSTWCRWFSTSTEHGPFQGGRNAIFVTKFFEQVFAGNKHYIDFNQVHASDNYYLGTSFVWIPASHENCSYLIQIYPNFVYCSDSNQIKDRRLQWDPGGFSVMSAWGQAEFQGGRDVRNLTWVQRVGLPSWASKDGLGPANPPRRTAATYTLQEVTNRISRLDQDETAAALLSHLRL